MSTEPFTLVVKIEDVKVFQEVWDAFRKDSSFHGAKITAAGWGHAFRERDKYKEVAEAAFKDGKSFGIVFDELPSTIHIGEKCFYHAGIGVFSAAPPPNQFNGEWYPSYDELRKAYPTLPEDPYELP